MAQTGYTPIQLYLSSTASAVPLAANLAAGELAINTVDGKLYYKSNAGVVTLLASSTTVTNSFSAGTTGLTPNTATTGAVTLAGTLITTNGGTGLSTYTAGDLSYFASGTALTKLAIGTSGYLLTSSGTAPQWSNSINNVIIGASTPLAGSFTNLDYAGTLTGSTGVLNIGSGQFYKDASGNVGIGTSSPGAKLDVQGATVSARVKATSGSALLSLDAAAAQQSLILFFANGVEQARILSPANEAASQLIFTTGPASTERMRIDASGNVGIGTSSSGAKLEVSSANNIVTSRGTAGYGAFYALASGTNSSYLFMGNGGGEKARITSLDDGALTFSNTTASTERMRIDASGSLILVGSTAQKATGTTWSNPSDQRLKDNIRDYAKGMTELMQVRVREWEYNGKGGTVEGTKGLGVIADEVMTVLPNTVENYDAKLNADDDETTAIKKFDATEITWLLVKAFQELKADFDLYKSTHP